MQLPNYKKKKKSSRRHCHYLSWVASVLREGPKPNTTGSAALLLPQESERCRTARQILCCGKCCCTQCCAGRSLSGLSPSFSCMDRSRLKNTKEDELWICWSDQRPRGVEEYCRYIDSLQQREQVQTRCRDERDQSAAHLGVIGSCNDNSAVCLWNALVQPWCRQTAWTRAMRYRFQLKPQQGAT